MLQELMNTLLFFRALVLMCRTIPLLLVPSPTPLHVSHTVEHEKAPILVTPHDTAGGALPNLIDTAVAGQSIVGTGEGDLLHPPFLLHVTPLMPTLPPEETVENTPVRGLLDTATGGHQILLPPASLASPLKTI